MYSGRTINYTMILKFALFSLEEDSKHVSHPERFDIFMTGGSSLDTE